MLSPSDMRHKLDLGTTVRFYLHSTYSLIVSITSKCRYEFTAQSCRAQNRVFCTFSAKKSRGLKAKICPRCLGSRQPPSFFTFRAIFCSPIRGSVGRSSLAVTVALRTQADDQDALSDILQHSLLLTRALSVGLISSPLPSPLTSQTRSGRRTRPSFTFSWDS